MKRILVVAMNSQGVIGKRGKIPWHCSEDLKFFKKLTEGHDDYKTPIVMGRKTYESLPKKLSHRLHLVLTKNPLEFNKGLSLYEKDVISFKWAGDEYQIAKSHNGWADKIFIIGGAETYNEYLKKDLIDFIYVNQIKNEEVDLDDSCVFFKIPMSDFTPIAFKDYSKFSSFILERKRKNGDSFIPEI